MLDAKSMLGIIKSVYGLNSPQVFSAMEAVPRENFVPSEYKNQAYADSALPIGFGQTLSQPYTVALMTDLLLTPARDKVLEIGTGSGYQAAILAKLFKKVYTIEIIPELAKRAREILKRLGYNNVLVRVGSGEQGWKEFSPFDAIMVTAAIKKKVPQELFDQLKVGGVLVAPVGEGLEATMTRFVKIKGSKFKIRKFGIFSFVPFVKTS